MFGGFDSRPREIGLAWLLGQVCTKKARFKKLVCLHHIK